MNFHALANEPRLLIEVPLKPVQGTRFQPTGFPDLGAAAYTLADGAQMLLVESAQSMANRLESSCWDENTFKPIPELDGVPYVESTLPDGSKTGSLLEAHRLNSPYIVMSREFAAIAKEIDFEKNKPFNRQKLVKALFRYDPHSLLHGVFLEKIGGVVRLPRCLTGFIEASNVTIASSGGAKVDRVQPGTKEEKTSYGKTRDGYGNVIFPREEYTGDIRAYFNLDLALIAGFDLPAEAKKFLIALALLKIRRFLRFGLRLRTACDLDAAEPMVTRPREWNLPQLEVVIQSVKELIKENTNSNLFVKPFKTEVVYDLKLAKAKKKEQEEPATAEVEVP